MNIEYEYGNLLLCVRACLREILGAHISHWESGEPCVCVCLVKLEQPHRKSEHRRRDVKQRGGGLTNYGLCLRVEMHQTAAACESKLFLLVKWRLNMMLNLNKHF